MHISGGDWGSGATGGVQEMGGERAAKQVSQGNRNWEKLKGITRERGRGEWEVHTPCPPPMN